MGKEILIQLHNTLGLISTKGQDTLYMAACLQTVEQLIQQAEIQEAQQEQQAAAPQE